MTLTLLYALRRLGVFISETPQLELPNPTPVKKYDFGVDEYVHETLVKSLGKKVKDKREFQIVDDGRAWDVLITLQAKPRETLIPKELDLSALEEDLEI
mgnify:CR=1 FL=1